MDKMDQLWMKQRHKWMEQKHKWMKKKHKCAQKYALNEPKTDLKQNMYQTDLKKWKFSHISSEKIWPQFFTMGALKKIKQQSLD